MSLWEHTARLLVASLLGGIVALVYRVSHGRANPDRQSFAATLVLLAALIAFVTIVIGGSVAKAFSLVGALSIVRFRTVVEDTRDTAFVIFAVVVGMAAGSGYFLLPAVGIPLVGSIAIAMSLNQSTHRLGKSFDVTVRLAVGRSPQEGVEPFLERGARRVELRSVESAKQGTMLDYTYRVQMARSDSLSELASQLAQLDGVQGIDYSIRDAQQ